MHGVTSPSRSQVRDQALDAVGTLLAGSAWSDVPMAKVAETAGVSRQTLYNEFGGRPELAQAYVMREVDAFVAAVEAVATPHVDDPRAALAAAFDLFLTAAATHPLISQVAAGTGDDLLPLLNDAAVVERGTARLAGFFHEHWSIEDDDAWLVAESVVRLAISHATVPSGPAPLTAQAVARLLGPFVEELLA